MTTIVCIKAGTKYDARYVNNLLAGVKRATTVPYHFICLTDDQAGVECETIPLLENLEGWWNKVTLFKPEPYGLKGDILFIDLDTLVVGNIDAMLEFDVSQRPVFLEDFMRKGFLASGVFKFLAGSLSYIWDKFDYAKIGGYTGDQDYIGRCIDNINSYAFWPQEWCISYKLHAKDTGPKPGTKLVCFHGRPMPHEVHGWVNRYWPKTNTFFAQAPSLPKVKYNEYEIEHFHGLGQQLRYRCKACGFDNYELMAVVKHYNAAHRAKKPAMPLLYDHNEKQIQREEEIINGANSLIL